MSTRLEWTPPLCSLSHLQGLPSGYQITLVKENMVTLISTKTLRSIKDYVGPEARRVGEEWAVKLWDEHGERP